MTRTYRRTEVAHVREVEGHWDTMPEAYVYIGRRGYGRDGPFGNPFSLAEEADRDRVVDLFEAWFLEKIATDPDYRESVEDLGGKVLVCFCKPLRCHGDVIAAWLNGDRR